MKSSVIRIEYLSPTGYLAIDSKNAKSVIAGSIEAAAVRLIRENPAVYRILFIDLSDTGIPSTFYNGHDTREVVIFHDRKPGTDSKSSMAGFRATTSTLKKKLDSFALKAEDAAFNLIAGNHPVFGIDFDLSLSAPQRRDSPKPDEFEIAIGQQLS